MTFQVLMTVSAEKDIDSIFSFIEQEDGHETAKEVVQRVIDGIDSLQKLPSRGSVVPELARLGYRFFRQIHVKPFRVVYMVAGDLVTIIAVLDSRRDVAACLARRGV